ncbi:Flp family type IVb pilin [Symbiopectobacterium sp.]|uniref:Flp family type IVb pilin n=1 Tax=Symbiopectobacterium sp. TaxID=2952789 RepID=UPI003F68479B
MYSLASYFQGKSIVSYMYFTEAMHNFKNDQRGVTAVEYAIVAAGVAVVVSVVFGESGPVREILSGIFIKIKTTVENSVK